MASVHPDFAQPGDVIDTTDGPRFVVHKKSSGVDPYRWIFYLSESPDGSKPFLMTATMPRRR